MFFNKISLCVALVVYTLTFQSTTEAAVTAQRRRDGYDVIAQTCKPSNSRAQRIKASFSFAYNGYSRYAYRHDDLLPVSNGFYNSRYK